MRPGIMTLVVASSCKLLQVRISILRSQEEISVLTTRCGRVEPRLIPVELSNVVLRLWRQFKLVMTEMGYNWTSRNVNAL